MYPILAEESAELSSFGTLVVILFGIGFYFAVGVAIVVFRRGQRRWSLWAALSAIVPVASIIVPIMALQQGRPEPVVVTEPCPGCGGHTGWADEGRFDRESKERIPHVATAIISGVLGVAIGIAALFVAVSIWRGGDSSCSGAVCIEWENGAVVAGIGFLVIGLWLASWVGHWALAYIGANAVTGTSYRCSECPERWVRLDTGPVPAF